MGKIVIYVGLDGVVKQLALRLDTSVTKKALGSSQLKIESLETEIGDGIVWIMGVTIDAFGAAVEEAILVLRHIDSRASDIYLLSPEKYYRKSLVIPNQMNANAPRGIVKVTGPMLLTSVKNATAAKMNSWDNMPEPEVDIFELAAKKLNIAALKIVLRHYYHCDANKCRQITKMLRGESSETPDTLMHLIVSYWKEKYDASLDVAAIINGHDDIHRKEPKLSVHAMSEMLLKAHHGDIPLCNKIKKAVKGNASYPNTLVHMINLLSN